MQYSVDLIDENFTHTLCKYVCVPVFVSRVKLESVIGTWLSKDIPSIFEHYVLEAYPGRPNNLGPKKYDPSTWTELVGER